MQQQWIQLYFSKDSIFQEINSKTNKHSLCDYYANCFKNILYFLS